MGGLKTLAKPSTRLRGIYVSLLSPDSLLIRGSRGFAAFVVRKILLGISAVGFPGWTFTYRDLVVEVLGGNQEENLELLS